MAKKIGRPTKLEEKGPGIIETAREGNYRNVCARANGIHPSTLNNWIARGEEGGPGNEAFCAFLEDLMRAEAEAEVAAVAAVKRGYSVGDEDWRAATEFLRRRYADRWSTSDRVNGKVDHHHSGTVSHEVEQKVDEDIAHLLEKRS